MKKAFTLIELIFVIVIIGLLAAVAVPKFLKLKQHAQVNSVVKTTVDSAQQAAEAAVNKLDLDDNNSFKLSDIVSLKGKSWNYTDSNTTTDKNGTYFYTDPLSEKNVSNIQLDIDNRKVEYKINCGNFYDDVAKKECNKSIGYKSTLDVNITF